ncbi:hypothetical protein FI667_g8274, partial [Globisporangium splendens]
MINRRRSNLPTFQRLQASMREFDNLPFPPMGTSSNPNNPNNHLSMNPLQVGSVSNPNGAAIIPPSLASSACAPRQDSTAWREEGGDDLRRLRSRNVVLIERMLRNHQPHDVLTQVPENYDWRSKTFLLAIKIEKLMFLAATSRENYLNEHTLRSRVQLLSRHLVRIRKRKNAMASALAPPASV